MIRLIKKYSFFIIIITLCNLAQAQLVINEVQSSNTSISISGTPDWVEIYNSGTSAVNISGYYLTDDISNPTKWMFQSPSADVPTTIEAGEYLVVLCNDEVATIFDDYYQTNFKLSSSGEEVHLYDASVNLISSLVFPALQQNESYGYNSDNELGIFSIATIGAKNGSINFTLLGETLATPAINLPYQIFTSSQEVSITSEDSGTIYYTLDGSNPITSSLVYTNPFNVSTTTVVKFIVIQSATAKSNIAMRTLLFNKTHELPIISITSENYVEFGSVSSQKPEFDGRVWVEMTESDGALTIAQYADYTASGATSTSVPPMNGKVRAKEKYGVDHFDNNDGAIFPNKPDIDKVYGFLIRNASQDWGTAKLRDAFASQLISEDDLIDFGFQDYKPVVVYLNGEYQGVLSIREDDDSDFEKNNYPDQTVVEYELNELFNLVRLTEVADTTERNTLLETVNMRDYYFYVFHYNFLEGAEISEYGYKVDGEKADWIMHDEDFGLEDHLLGGYIKVPISYYVSRIESYEPFKEDLIQSWCAYANFLYDSDRTVAILNNMEAGIESEMDDTIQFYKDFIAERGLTSSFFEHVDNVTDWKAEVDVIRNIITPRLDNMFTDFMTQYTLDAPEDFIIASNNIDQGSVRVQGIKLREETMTGQFFKDMPIELIAEPNLGYQFSHWEGLSTSTDAQINVTLSTSAEITAVFEAIPTTAVSLHINEVQGKNDTTYADEFGEYNDWIEIYNSGSTDVDLAGFYFSDNPDITNKYQILSGEPEKTTVPANDYLVLWLDNDSEQGANHLDFKLDATDQVLMVNVDGVSIIDYLEFDLNADESYGSSIDGTSDYIIFTTPTPNATNQTTLSINDFISETNVKLYPNPILFGEITIESNSQANIELALFDMLGRQLKNQIISNKRINVSDLKPGNYIVKITQNNKQITKQLIVK